MKASEHGSGYRFDKVFVAEQSFRIVSDPDRLQVVSGAERQVTFGWDWRPVGPRRFEVVVTINVEPCKDSPEAASVRLVGLFSTGDGPLSIRFSDFLRENAPAILFPYAREVISTMTARGPFGAFHLDPVNVRSLLAGVDITVSTGHRQLGANPEFARSFGLEIELDAPVRQTT